jgi:hypothetical protein
MVCGVAVVLWCGRIAWDYFDENSVAHESMQFQLKMFGSAIYEYHTANGRWPSGLDDLEQTSLADHNPMWRPTAETFVFLWPQNLSMNPRDNADVVLAYDPSGWFNRMGRQWVLWGDLRTEHMRERDLRLLAK